MPYKDQVKKQQYLEQNREKRRDYSKKYYDNNKKTIVGHFSYYGTYILQKTI